MNRIEQKYGDLVGACFFIKEVDPKINKITGVKIRKGVFRCPECGENFICAISKIRMKEKIKCNECSCKSRVKKKETHGMRKHPLFHRWHNMKNRCHNEKNPMYYCYGGRGIRVCEEWRNDIKLYIDYITNLDDYGKVGYTIDRIDNDGDYEPGNVRCVSRSVQLANTRNRKNTQCEYRGVTKMRNYFQSALNFNSKRYYFGTFKTAEEAVMARDKFIIENKFTEFKTQVL